MNSMETIASTGAKPIAKAELKKPVTGYEAQGFALAMRVFAIQRTAARELHRVVVSLFELDPDARAACAKHLGDRKDTIKEMVAQGRLTEKEASKMLASATVYASQMRTVIKAMNAGMTKDTVLTWCNGGPLKAGEEWATDAFDAVSFATIYKVAADMVASEAKGRGRPKMAFAAKLSAWLLKNGPDEADAEGLRLYNAIVEMVNEVNAPKGEEAPM